MHGQLQMISLGRSAALSKKINVVYYNIHSKVRATYSVFEDGGKRYFQIDTYGSATRDMPEKISQTIQIDRHSAMKLIALLAETFQDSE